MTVKLNLARLRSIQTTMEAIERIEQLIEYYGEDKPGPAYITCKKDIGDCVDVQIDRKIMINALEGQLNKLILSVEDRYGFEYDSNAPWNGDG